MYDIHILGAGAMGCLWASYFDKESTINFVVKPNHPWLTVNQPTSQSPTAYEENTGQISDDIIHETNNIQLACLPEDRQLPANATTGYAIQKPISHLIVATKAYDALTAIRTLRNKINTNTQIVLLQNGFGSQQQVASEFSSNPVYACSSTHGAYKNNLFTLVHAGVGENKIGALTPSASALQLGSWLNTKHFQWESAIEDILWQKLMVNAAINPLTAHYHCKNGELLLNPEINQHMRRICQELDELNSIANREVGPVYDLAATVAGKTAENASSMYQDVTHQKPTEIDYITGHILNVALSLEIALPENQKIYDIIRSYQTT